jgi:hypothetical protein
MSAFGEVKYTKYEFCYEINIYILKYIESYFIHKSCIESKHHIDRIQPSHCRVITRVTTLSRTQYIK